MHIRGVATISIAVLENSSNFYFDEETDRNLSIGETILRRRLVTIYDQKATNRLLRISRNCAIQVNLNEFSGDLGKKKIDTYSYISVKIRMATFVTEYNIGV